MYWEITPYHNRDADSCVMPAETEADHRAALQYAMDRLELGWDDLKPGESITVTITRREGDIGDLGDLSV